MEAAPIKAEEVIPAEEGITPDGAAPTMAEDGAEEAATAPAAVGAEAATTPVVAEEVGAEEEATTPAAAVATGKARRQPPGGIWAGRMPGRNPHAGRCTPMACVPRFAASFVPTSAFPALFLNVNNC